MKYIIMAVISITMLKGCSQETSEQEMRSLTYTASSRGYYFQVTVDPTTVYVQSDRDGKNIQKNTLAVGDWQELNTLVSTVSVKELNNLVAPSEGRALDRAAIASLKVKFSGEAYESVPFDHGNPPTAIKAIIDKVLLLAESVDRQ